MAPRVLTGKFAFGNVLTFIIVFFIFLYADSQTKLSGAHWGWGVLAFITKWYLIISVGVILIAIVLPLLIFLLAMLIAMRARGKKKKKDYIEAEYEVKE